MKVAHVMTMSIFVLLIAACAPAPFVIPEQIQHDVDSFSFPVHVSSNFSDFFVTTSRYEPFEHKTGSWQFESLTLTYKNMSSVNTQIQIDFTISPLENWTLVPEETTLPLIGKSGVVGEIIFLNENKLYRQDTGSREVPLNSVTGRMPGDIQYLWLSGEDVWVTVSCSSYNITTVCENLAKFYLEQYSSNLYTD